MNSKKIKISLQEFHKLPNLSTISKNNLLLIQGQRVHEVTEIKEIKETQIKKQSLIVIMREEQELKNIEKMLQSCNSILTLPTIPTISQNKLKFIKKTRFRKLSLNKLKKL